MFDLKDIDKLKKEDLSLDNLQILSKIAEAISDKSELKELSSSLKLIVAAPKSNIDDLLKLTSEKDKQQIKELVEIIKLIFEDNQKHNKELMKNINNANRSVELLSERLDRDVNAKWEMTVNRNANGAIERTVMKRIQ